MHRRIAKTDGTRAPKPANSVCAQTFGACRGALLIVGLFSIFINLLMLTAPLYMLQVFDRVLSSQSTDTLFLLTAMALVALLALAALETARGFVLLRVGNWLDDQTSGHVLAGSIAATLRRGREPSVQGLRDLSIVRSFLSGPSILPVLDAPWTPIFLTVIFLMHPMLGWFSLAGALVLFSFAFASEIATRKLFQSSGGISIKALHEAEAAVRNADVIEAMGMMPQLVRRWRRYNSEVLRLQDRAGARSRVIFAASKFVRFGLQVGILGIGAWLVIQNELTAGAMIAASILMGRALAPVEQAIGAWKSMIAARGAYQRVRRQLEEMPPRGHAMPLPAPSGKLTAEGVTFVHPRASEPVIRGVSFELEPGEALAVVGPTAAGKSTLARLLVGNLVPRGGHVRLDAMDVAKWEREDIGRHIGYLPQAVELFSGTVRENIARLGMGDPDAVVTAAQIAGVHEMILRLEKGYDTEIGDGGTVLSGGQCQRIALARAIHGAPRFVVLDEPDANLDSEGEKAVLKALHRLKDSGATVVVITHRPGILRAADKVLVLAAGMVQAFGPVENVIRALPGAQPVQRLVSEIG